MHQMPGEAKWTLVSCYSKRKIFSGREGKRFCLETLPPSLLATALIIDSMKIAVITSYFPVPGPVRNLYASNDANGHVLLYWLPPKEYSACVHHYLVRMISDSDYMRVYYTANLYLNVTSWKNCVHYSFEVLSLNANGEPSPPMDIGYFFVPEGENLLLKHFVRVTFRSSAT